METPNTSLDAIIGELPRIGQAAESLRDALLAHLTLIGEIPAPTFQEGERANGILARFLEAGLSGCAVDEKGNAFAHLPGTGGGQNILVAAHADTVGAEAQDQTVEIQSDHVIGPFVGDNSIALAALATLPALLEKLNLRLKSTVHVLAAARSQGSGNLEGARHFLAANPGLFQTGLCLESVQLGRVNYASIGMLRAEITCRLPEPYDWANFGATGTIIPMSDVINRISQIPRPQRPLTVIIMGSIYGGLSHSNIARETKLLFEIRSESADILKQIHQQIEDIVEDVSAQSGINITLTVVARRDPGVLDISHPLVRTTRALVTALGFQPQLYATTSLMAALRDAGIPSLTLGITLGERKNELDEIDESVAIAPLSIGMAQLAGLLLAIDGGLTA